MDFPPNFYLCIKKVGISQFSKCAGVSYSRVYRDIKKGRPSDGVYQKYEMAIRMCERQLSERQKFADFRKRHPIRARRLWSAIEEIRQWQPPKVNVRKCDTPLLEAWQDFLYARVRVCAMYERIKHNGKMP